MKLISLNIWGAHEYEPFIAFVKKHASDTDIFCFQEIYTSPQALTSPNGTHLNILEDLQSILPDFEHFFAPIQDGMDEEGVLDLPTTFGLAMFVRKNHAMRDHGFTFAHQGRNTLVGSDFATLGTGFQYCTIITEAESVTVVNMYGTAHPGNKLDTPERLRQSALLKAFLDATPGPKIVCGDFNLFPETVSVTMLENPMRNLIKEYAIMDTRGPINAKKYEGRIVQHYADYTFVSPDINVISFDVPQVPVSDHLPMVLAFDTIQAPRA